MDRQDPKAIFRRFSDNVMITGNHHDKSVLDIARSLATNPSVLFGNLQVNMSRHDVVRQLTKEFDLR
jgi:hypothetical protein